MRTVDSTRTERAARGWLCTAAEREASKERTDTNGKRRGTREEEGRARAESARGDRKSTAVAHRAGEQARGNAGGEKERRGIREEREAERYRERERERGAGARVESGRTRERRRASACPAEGARRAHMCSETNVRSECRLLPIIRCRGVPLCARGWSADSVPRFYAARQPGPVRRARLSAKTAALNVSRALAWSTTVSARLELNPRPLESGPRGSSEGRCAIAAEGRGVEKAASRPFRRVA